MRDFAASAGAVSFSIIIGYGKTGGGLAGSGLRAVPGRGQDRTGIRGQHAHLATQRLQCGLVGFSAGGRQPGFRQSKTSELGCTEASWPDGFDAEVDATAISKWIAKVAAVEITFDDSAAAFEPQEG